MPKILEFGQYVIFFWSAENGEPVHVHIAVRRPTENATKVWLTSAGGALLANNNSRITRHDLNDLMELIVLNHRYICSAWSDTFHGDLKFYV